VTLHLNDLAIATVVAENLNLPTSITVEAFEDYLIAAGQGDEDDSAQARRFMPEL
jgi:hypothetical protein